VSTIGTEKKMAEEYNWDMTIKEICEKAAKNPPEMPHFQKLVTLAELKAAHHLAEYTKCLTYLTVVLAFCAVLQIALIFKHY
jgi:hypothetical protein